MRAVTLAAALVVCFASPGSAFDLQTKRGQVVCDTLRAFEELTIAISTKDDRAIEQMSGKGCLLPGAGLRMELIEAYPDQTVLLFNKLSQYTDIGPVPAHIERLTNLAQVRLLAPDAAPIIGFTMLPVSQRSDPPTN